MLKYIYSYAITLSSLQNKTNFLLYFHILGTIFKIPTNFYFHDFSNNNLFYSLTIVIPSGTKNLANNIEN